MNNTLISAMVLMVIVILILVAILLIIKAAITPKGKVKIDINDGKKVLEATPGGNLMGTLAEGGIFLPSACGGKANCGQCKIIVEAAEKSSPPKSASSTASRSRKAGDLVARSR